MVHEGGPSEGCDTCRARKVKCSLEKPSCLRCERAGFICLGYLRRPRAKLKLMSYKYTTTQSPESSPNQLEKCSPSTDTLTAAPAWPLTDQSMCFFFSQFVVRSETRPDAGWFDFVPHVLQDHGSSVPMNAALKAVSFLSLANRYHRTDIMVDALQLNGRALEAVNEALASPSEAREDGTFAAILLLCLFGHINGDLRRHIGAHATGMFRLLALRNATGLNSPHAKSFARHVVALMHLDNNDRYIPLAAVPERGAPIIPPYSSDDLFERLIMLWPCSAALSNGFCDIPTINDARRDIDVVLRALSVWQDFENSLRKVSLNLDSAWQFTTGPKPSAWNDDDLVATTRKTLVYPDSWTMAIWHAYRVTTISLQTALVKIYTMLEDDTLADCKEVQQQTATIMRHRSLAIIDSMNEDICATIPWTLGQIGRESEADLPVASRASLSIAGLRAVVNGVHSRQQHLLQARAALSQIAHRFGIKAALV